MTFIDFTKAFDLVNKNCMWRKLQQIRMLTKIINIIRNIYLLPRKTFYTASP